MRFIWRKINGSNARWRSKFLNPEFAQDESKLNRFIQEAKAASALNHPNIMTVYEIGEVENTHFIATEFIEGKTLRSLMRKVLCLSNKLISIAIQTAEAFATAHAAGIAHRDIKPENVMVRHDGYVKVLDFGLAKLLEREELNHKSKESSPNLVKTTPGMIMGTPLICRPNRHVRRRLMNVRTFGVWVSLYMRL